MSTTPGMHAAECVSFQRSNLAGLGRYHQVGRRRYHGYLQPLHPLYPNTFILSFSPIAHHRQNLKMILLSATCLVVCALQVSCENTKLAEVIAWSAVDYAWEKPEDKKAAIDSKEFVPNNNLPLGLDVWQDKLFVTVPRWKDGVIATLNYVNLTACIPAAKGDKEKKEVNEPVANESLPSQMTVGPFSVRNEELNSPGKTQGRELATEKPKKPKVPKPCTDKCETTTEPTTTETATESTEVPPPASPALVPYPSFNANKLISNRSADAEQQITSVFRVRVDSCDRLWVMDSGLADILGNPTVYSKPQVLVYDLKTDKLLRKYILKETDLQEHSFFANIIVDVEAGKCNDAVAYLPDLGSYAVIVYDFAKDKSWRITHNFFHFDPLAGNMKVGGVNFQWTDGVFSLALTKPRDDGFRTAYFHALSSTKEFQVSTQILRNEGKHNYYDFKLVGDRGADSQSSASFIHEDTGVLFYTQLQKDGVSCWNTNKKFDPENLVEIASDNETMIFVNDLKVDYENNLWVLTDKLPIFVYQGIDDKEVNYRIFKAPVEDVIAGTNCAP